MKNKEISTKTTFSIIFLTIIIIGIVFYSLNNSNKIKSTPAPYLKDKDTINKEQYSNQQSFVPLTNEMKKAFRERFPTWDINKIKIFIKEDLQKYRFGYLLNNSNQEGHFFATKVDSDWTITNFGYNNPYGYCEIFTKYNYPEKLIPDCIDSENRVTVSSNPDLFYSFVVTEKERKEIKKSFIDFIKNNQENYYTNKELSLRIDNNTKNNLKGMIMVVGKEEHSTPYILATKINDKWKVILQSQDIPPCELVDKYNIPTKLFWPYSENACWDVENKNIRKQ